MKDFKIKTVEDVKDFFRYLVNELSLSFHPDDDFKDYVRFGSGGERMFDDEWADRYNVSMGKCFMVCKRKGKDIYGVGMKVLSKRLKLG